MKLSLGFSPCPNDTYMFDALVHKKIDTEGIDFSIVMADVEELNQRALAGDADITKLSFHAFAHLISDYELLDAGSALGNNCGPLLIARNLLTDSEVNRAQIAIPGKYTTANFLLGIAYPDAVNKRELLFSEIEDAILNNEVEAGLIIHENRFTYQSKGLIKIIDLGEYWENLTGLPIPLGGIVIRKRLPAEVKQKVNRLIRKSVEYAFANPEDSATYVRAHAQEMDEDVMYQHIRLYVNEFSKDLGSSGKKAVIRMFELARDRGLIPGEASTRYFLNEP